MKNKCLIILLVLFFISLINSKKEFANLNARTMTAEFYKERNQNNTHYKYIRYTKKKNKRKRQKKNKSQKSKSYIIPRRAIEFTPYYNYIYANKLYENIEGVQSGHGGGLKMRYQLFGSFGYIINASINHLGISETPTIVQNNDKDIAAIIIGGPYYSYDTSYGDIRFDIGYGAIAAGDSTMTIFLPSIEYRLNIFSRISLMLEIGYPIANDWIVNQDYNEHYRSFSSAGGIGITF